MIVRSLQKREQAKDSSEFGETGTVKHCSFAKREQAK
jgi:hypothetical protein